MVEQFPKPNILLRFVQLLRKSIRQFDDISLALKIGYFVLKLPRMVDRTDLPRLLTGLRRSARPSALGLSSNLEQICRLRQLWLCLPMLRARNTCYVRAMTLYRFLDSGQRGMRIHFAVELGRNPEDRLRGHAWVTVDGQVLEELSILEKHLREVYVHPPLI